MSLGERDPHTGHMTTGHQWNGITELNTAVPRSVWIFLGVAFAVSVVMWVLLPAWPLGSSYTSGLLKFDERAQLKHALATASADRAQVLEKIPMSTFAQVRRDPELMNSIRSAGKPLFSDNCAVCHGMAGAGGPGYPDLTDNVWLWGGDDQPAEHAILETLRVGINSQHVDGRLAQMPAFGRDGMIDRQAVLAVINHLHAINMDQTESAEPDQRSGNGAAVFADNCAACHGETGKGDQDIGAPDLTDANWIYGGDSQSLFDTVWNGRQGHMPSWENRLSEADRRLLTFYILDLNDMHPLVQR